MTPTIEAVLVGAGGAALGALVGLPFGVVFVVVFAVVAGVSGAFSGYRQIYHWKHWRGWVAFVLDSTWGMIGTLLADLLHAANLFWPKWSPPQGDSPDRRVRYHVNCSRRQNRHVYFGGAAFRPRYAFTQGNVISNADSGRGKPRPLFLGRHEGLHVWQNRIFGPLYQIIYVLWTVVGAVVGAAYSLFDSSASLRLCVDTVAYYDNPYEYWAYVNDHNWPPGEGSALRRLVWPWPAEQSEADRKERDRDRAADTDCVPPA